MPVYLATIIGIAAMAFTIGWRWGRRKGAGHNLTTIQGIILLGLGASWFTTANLARSCADTNSSMADLAGWFAHSGKWFSLLAAIFAGHGMICAQRQIPKPSAQRILYFVAVLGTTTIIVSRTVPVYFLLGDGRRDADGLLRQSNTIETTCGAVALLNYLELFRHHPPLTESEVTRACDTTMEGTTTFALVKGAHQFGLTNTTAQMLTLDELDHTRMPVIVSISTLPTVHQATLLIRLDAERADFIDPAYGKWSVSRGRFQEIWYGKTVLLAR